MKRTEIAEQQVSEASAAFHELAGRAASPTKPEIDDGILAAFQRLKEAGADATAVGVSASAVARVMQDAQATVIALALDLLRQLDADGVLTDAVRRDLLKRTTGQRS